MKLRYSDAFSFISPPPKDTCERLYETFGYSKSCHLEAMPTLGTSALGMLSTMWPWSNQFQVFDAIISPIAVHMMNCFVRLQRTIQMLSHHESMFSDCIFVTRNQCLFFSCKHATSYKCIAIDTKKASILPKRVSALCPNFGCSYNTTMLTAGISRFINSYPSFLTAIRATPPNEFTIPATWLTDIFPSPNLPNLRLATGRLRWLTIFKQMPRLRATEITSLMSRARLAMPYFYPSLSATNNTGRPNIIPFGSSSRGVFADFSPSFNLADLRHSLFLRKLGQKAVKGFFHYFLACQFMFAAIFIKALSYLRVNPGTHNWLVLSSHRYSVYTLVPEVNSSRKESELWQIKERIGYCGA